jgi:hypothetical protein
MDIIDCGINYRLAGLVRRHEMHQLAHLRALLSI